MSEETKETVAMSIIFTCIALPGTIYTIHKYVRDKSHLTLGHIFIDNPWLFWSCGTMTAIFACWIIDWIHTFVYGLLP